MKLDKPIYKYLLSLVFIFSSAAVFGQDAGATNSFQITLTTLVVVFSFILLVIALAMFRIAIHIKQFLNKEIEVETGVKQQNMWERFFQVKDVSTDKDTVIDHPHDGIYELDNAPPPWFMYFFYLTVVFAVGYYVRFTFLDSGYTQEEEYLAELADAEAAQAKLVANKGGGDKVDESKIAMLTDASELLKGEEIYNANCFSCHGKYLEGMENSGPNLRDEFWKHGGSYPDIYKTIKYGVVEKGMAEWGKMMGSKSLEAVASYVASMKGKPFPPEAKPKAPEGDKYTPEATKASDVSDENTAQSDSAQVVLETEE